MMLCFIFIHTLLFGQLQSADKTQILALMDKYDKAIINMDTDGILSLYEVDGIFGDVKGHDAIRKYLSGFSKTKVTRYASTTDKVVVTSGLATHTGTFIQEVISNGSRKVYNGAFRIIWSKNGGSWKIKFMTTELDHSR